MQIALLGPLEVRADSGATVEVGGTRLRTLLILLALDAGRVSTTSRLIDGVWPDTPPAGAPNALQALVSRLRRALPGLPVHSHPAGYRLAIRPDQVDVARFEQLVAAGRAALPRDPASAAALLHEALDLWRGPALADVAEADFARAPVARLSELRLNAVEDRIEAELRLDTAATRQAALAGARGGLLAELEELAAAYPMRERVADLQIRALYAAGRPGDALTAYERIRATLADRLGADPSPALAALHLAILRGGPDLAAPAPNLAGVAAPAPNLAGVAAPAVPARTNLRTALTSFVGRDEDVFRVGKLVSEARLATLTGPGGAGKTRLAVESGHTLLDQMPDGVWLVEFAPVTDVGAGELAQTVLTALGLREKTLLTASPGRPMPGAPAEPGELGDALDRLLDALSGKRLLLVLDNCEHLLDAAATLVDRVLGGCPEVRVLATSREPLGITGENLWPVGPLAMPPEAATPGEAGHYPSVRLFADRAAAVRPGFAIDDETVAPVLRICRALDGMPLAIELAAAKLRAMTPGQVATRLVDRFRLLTGGSRTALPRHQTLRAVVDWSWELLDERERTLLRRMAVFAGGATVEAAEQVCAGGVVAPREVLDLLTTLVEKSLLVADCDHSSPRYRMLETIRAYGVQRLAEAGEEASLRRAHLAHFLAFAERAEPHLRRADQLLWLTRLGDEHDNLHAALRSAIAEGEVLAATRLVASLGFYWWMTGRRAEGTELAIDVLAMPGEVAAPVRAGAYLVSALNGVEAHRDFETVQGWFATAAQLMAHTTAEELAGAPAVLHPLLRMLRPFNAMIELNADERTLPVFEELEEDADPWIRSVGRMMRAHLLLNLGRRHAEAEADFHSALDGFRALGERWGIAFALTALAELVSWRGDHDLSAVMLREALANIEELGTQEDTPQLLVRYGRELWLRGDRGAAAGVLAQAQSVAEQVGMRDVLTHVEIARAEVARLEGEEARLEGDARRAEELFATAQHRLSRAYESAPRFAWSEQFVALAASGRGFLASALGDFAAARRSHAEALDAALTSRDAPVTAMVMVGIADLAIRTGEAARAAMLLGAAAKIRGVRSADYPDSVRVERQARHALGEPAFAESYRRGHAATMATVAGLAVPTLGQPGATTSQPGAATPSA